MSDSINAIRLLSLAECGEILEEARGGVWQSAKVVYETGGTGEMEAGFRSSLTIREIEEPQPFFSARRVVEEKIGGLLRKLEDRFVMSHMNYVRYRPGDFISPHCDATPRSNPHRAFTFVCFLNEGFTGGALAFPEMRRSFTPATGRAIVFPSRLQHAGELVEAGEKIILQFYLGVRGECPTDF